MDRVPDWVALSFFGGLMALTVVVAVGFAMLDERRERPPKTPRTYRKPK